MPSHVPDRLRAFTLVILWKLNSIQILACRPADTVSRMHFKPSHYTIGRHAATQRKRTQKNAQLRPIAEQTHRQPTSHRCSIPHHRFAAANLLRLFEIKVDVDTRRSGLGPILKWACSIVAVRESAE